MKRTILAALVAIFVFSTPVTVMAQDDEPETAAEVVAVEVVDDNSSNFFDLGMWFFSLFSVLSIWGGFVSIAIIDKGIKEFVMGILTKLPSQYGWQGAVRLTLIYGAVFVASIYVVVDRDVNVFNSAPQQVLAMIPSLNAQLAITAGVLALSVFLTHNVKQWFASEPAQVVREAA